MACTRTTVHVENGLLAAYNVLVLGAPKARSVPGYVSGFTSTPCTKENSLLAAYRVLVLGAPKARSVLGWGLQLRGSEPPSTWRTACWRRSACWCWARPRRAASWVGGCSLGLRTTVRVEAGLLGTLRACT